VTLLVGDPSVSQGVQWQLGVVELVLPEADGKPAVRTVKTQPTSNQKPIINHIFVSWHRGVGGTQFLGRTGQNLF
jgi:hypothetical protein